MKEGMMSLPFITFEHKRDAYGFAVRSQNLQRYREYANIYKEEEEERSERWKNFLERQVEAAQLPISGISAEESDAALGAENRQQGGESISGKDAEVGATTSGKSSNLEESNVEESASTNETPNLEKPSSGNEMLKLEKTDSEKDSPSLTSEKCDGSEEIISEKETSISSGRKHNGLAESILQKEKPLLEIQKDEMWAQLRPALGVIEYMMSLRVKKRKYLLKNEQQAGSGDRVAPIEEARPVKGVSENDSDEEFFDVEKSDQVQDMASSECANACTVAHPSGDEESPEPFFPWKEELECLVRGGVPMALRGEFWQAFVGVRARRLKRYYQDLLAQDKSGEDKERGNSHPNDSSISETEKWKRQIEKDLPRTFPGHPALDEDGRDALRRLLTAYARHNPSVGYCQAMNYFAGLLLLLMNEETAFWALIGIIDDYFEGYYTEEMIESQVDQLVFEELMRERFPKLVNHLDYLGVQAAWVTGSWFLSIFVNMIPWESVLRVWDVILFEGNRVMLFRTALALMELYGPALVTTKDAGDAVILLQSLTGSTFDSSQLVLTACMGYQVINEARLQELREKHRPTVLAVLEERAKGNHVWKDSQGLASKLYSFKHDPGLLMPEKDPMERSDEIHQNGDLSITDPDSRNLDEFLNSLSGVGDMESGTDLQEQVVWLKVELCRLLEEKRSATLRAEELETALMEMVKQDNRRQLSARVEQLEQEVAELQQALADKQEQERAMLQVLMRVEQEQRLTEDARRFAEQDAAAQRYATNVLQGKYDEAMASLAKMEKRAVMAESMLEATVQYQSGQVKAQPPSSASIRSGHPDASPTTQDLPSRKLGLLSRPFGLGWRDKNKGKASNVEEPNESKPSSEERKKTETPQKGINGHQQTEK